MRTTSDLIRSLADDLTPAPDAWVARRIATGFATGATISVAFTMLLWGPRPDLATAVGTWPFWIKFAFTGLLALAGLAGVDRLGRPDGRGGHALFTGVVTFAGMAGSAMLQLERAPANARHDLLMGATAASCPWLIILLSIPILAGGIWAVRAMAPTRLFRAGGAVGLAAGSMAAFVYAVSCDESGLPFVLVWYGLGIAVPVAVGAISGPRLLRW